MRQLSSYRTLAAITLLAIAAALPLQAQNAARPDSTLFTTYSIYPGYGFGPLVDWVVCGSTADSEGCYTSGQIGPFVAVGAMLEGNPSVSGNAVTRALYIVDSGDATVKLYVYTKTDTVTASYDTVTLTLTDTVSLPLTGGSDVTTSMAANGSFLFIGTNQSTEPVKIRKSNRAVSKLDIISGGVTFITSNQYGYVTVAQSEGFAVYGPNGALEEYGGGSQFVLGTTQAMPVSTLTSNSSATAPGLQTQIRAVAEK